MIPQILAGTPQTTAFAGTSAVTTQLVPMTALSPIETPRVIVALAPIQTLLPIRIAVRELLKHNTTMALCPKSQNAFHRSYLGFRDLSKTYKYRTAYGLFRLANARNAFQIEIFNLMVAASTVLPDPVGAEMIGRRAPPRKFSRN